MMNHSTDVEVSIAEVCEVRGCALESSELLAIAASAADHLPPCPKGIVFDTENVFLTARGNVTIHTVPSTSVDSIFMPPEWSRGENDPNAAAVYCMGAVMRASGAEHAADVDLFSLVNILTVGMVGTRPTAHRMGQMAKNQLQGRNAQSILISLYEEVMGDEESNRLPIEDMDYEDLDELDDDFEMAPVRQTKMKLAVEYISDSDEKETRGASLSTSSGTSTQKETSPFDEEIVEEEIVEQKVPSPVRERSPISFAEIGSPIGNSTRLDDTYIEEKSFDLSFDRSTESKESHSFNMEEIVPVRETASVISPSKRPIENPFNDNDELQGTLSGRDPFEQPVTSNRSSSPPAKKSPPSELSHFSMDSPPQQRHRFSSSEDSIVEAHIDDDDEFASSARGTGYFSEIVRKEEEIVPVFKQTKAPTTIKHAAAVEQLSSASEMSQTTYASSSTKRGSESTFTESCELEQLKAETQKLREEAGRLHSQETEKILELERMETPVLSSYDDEENDNVSRGHIEAAVVIADPPARTKSAQMVAESESDDNISEELSIDEAFHEARRNSQTPSKPEPIVSPIEDSPPKERMERHNSLVPARISRRTSNRNSRGKRKTRAVPEFYDTSKHPSIRLKAPSSRKKKVTLMRVEQTEVWVELLNGQRVEVACRTDVAARDVFSLVVQHMNINEHIFFGLSVMRDGEHFFLEDHQRLEKYAPAGWKSGSRAAQRHQYILFLRFRFYPQILEFIKTPITMHELYLQVRRDVIDERIQPKRDAAFELAAVALQAEFGNRPPPAVVDYFDNEHYLAKRFCSNDDPRRLKVVLADLHNNYANVPSIEAEHKFIQICQRHSDFGAHLHRVFRSKPAMPVGAAPFDPDTGAALWIAIMPRGISVYEEEGGVRQKLSEHLWPDTQTLQFDKKKFVIIAVRDGHQTETIFYTDHHTKSSYFVKFSASQHRFMMKMRAWKTTLRHENTIHAMPDVAVEGTPAPAPVRVLSPSPLDEAGSMFEKMPQKRPSVAPPQMPSSEPPVSPEPAPRVLDVSMASTNISERVDANETVSNSLLERFEAAAATPNGVNDEAMKFEVFLNKDPKTGLGLTLVDGNLKGVKGVYVKSVVENGAGMRAGLRVGDRLLSVGGISLEDGDRHKAVELVKACNSQVVMEIERVDGIVRHEKSLSRDGDVLSKQSALSSNGTPKGVSRTPPVPRRAGNRRVRAVSDFGAIGDQLPALDNENVINIKAISGLHLDESDEEKGEYRLPTASLYAFDRYDEDEPLTPVKKTQSSSSPMVSRGVDAKKKYRYARKSSNPEWTEDQENAEDNDDLIYVTLERNAAGSLGVQIATVNGRATIKQLTSAPAAGHPDISVGMVLVSVNGVETAGKVHKDVVTLLRQGQEVVLGLKIDQQPQSSAEDSDTFTVTLRKTEFGSFGLSLSRRTGSEGHFIRKIADGSAASEEGSLKVGDRVVSLDGVPVDGLPLPTIHDRLNSAPAGPLRITIARSS